MSEKSKELFQELSRVCLGGDYSTADIIIACVLMSVYAVIDVTKGDADEADSFIDDLSEMMKRDIRKRIKVLEIGVTGDGPFIKSNNLPFTVVDGDKP